MINRTTHNFPLIISQFKTKGSIGDIENYGSGHVHDTFRIRNAQPEFPDYVLQRINHNVFRNIPALTENIRKVTTHLREKIKTLKGAAPDKEVLTPILTLQDEGYYKDDEGNFWRMYYFLQDTCSFDVVQTEQQAYEGGKALGRFQVLLYDLDARSLHETIPNFHDVEDRLRIFEEVIQRDPVNRVKEVTNEIDFVKTRAGAMSIICRMGRQGELPLRITHNDTKFNNILFDRHDKAQCVIDLDTVMPGYAAYDFGDAMRTIINKAPEDEKDHSKIQLNITLFESFTQGYLKQIANYLSDAEVKSLSYAVLILPYIMGLRFLTDYIDGDKYYKIHFPDHNIQRARAQFNLVEKLEDQYPLLDRIIQKVAQSVKIAGNE